MNTSTPTARNQPRPPRASDRAAAWAWMSRGIAAVAREELREETKHCCACKVVKLVAEFNRNRSKPDGLQDQCGACSRSYRASQYKAHPEGHILSALKQYAAKCGVPFALTLDNLPPVPATCPVLAITLQRTKSAGGACSPRLHRLIPARGYVPGNVLWISNKAGTDLTRRTPSPEEAQ